MYTHSRTLDLVFFRNESARPGHQQNYSGKSAHNNPPRGGETSLCSWRRLHHCHPSSFFPLSSVIYFFPDRNRFGDSHPGGTSAVFFFKAIPIGNGCCDLFFPIGRLRCPQRCDIRLRLRL